MGDPVVARSFAKQFEPILIFHPSEQFFPIDPKWYLERSSLWRAASPYADKNNWGEPPRTIFPRLPAVDRNNLAALQSEAVGKTWIGEPSNGLRSGMQIIPMSAIGDVELRMIATRGSHGLLPAKDAHPYPSFFLSHNAGIADIAGRQPDVRRSIGAVEQYRHRAPLAGEAREFGRLAGLFAAFQRFLVHRIEKVIDKGLG